jgi:hypothetical protein
MLNRSLGAMITLLPGAREVGTSGTSAHGTSSSYVSFGGGGGRNYNMLVDGIDNKEDNCGGTMVVYSLEGIQEMKVLTTGASAEYGRGTTTILLATKSGTNQLHGTGFLYGRNQSLVRTDYFSDPAHGGFGKPPFDREQYGGSAGGPILKDRAWFFGSIERVSQNFNTPLSGLVVNERQLLSQALPGNQVLVAGSTPGPSRDTLAQGKFNVQLSHKHSGYLRYSSEYSYIDTGSTLTWTDINNRNHQSIWNLAGGETWLINPTTVNQLTAQWIEFTHDSHYPACPLPTTYLGVNLGANACLPQDLVFPTQSVGVGNIFPLWTDLDNKLEFKDDFSKQVGRHSLKAGGGFIKMPIFGGIFGSPTPSLTFFDDASTIVHNSNGKYPLGFLTPGIVRTLTITSTTIGDYSSAEKGLLSGGPTPCQANSTVDCARNDWGSGDYNVGVYFQDDFKVSPRVTLNLGLRYDAYNYLGPDSLLGNNRVVQVLQAVGSPYGKIPQVDKNNWGPRAGFAWDVHGDGKEVVRGSYGLYYVQILQQSTYQRNFLSQSVIQTTNTTTDAAVGTGTLANFVLGVTPIAAAPAAPTQLPSGGRTAGYIYDPGMQDAQSQQIHGGWSRVLPNETVLAIDYTHMIGQKGLRPLDVNPLIGGVRPLSALTQAVYGDPNLLGPVFVQSSVNRSLYDELAVHFEHRFSKGMAFQTNYSLAYARGMGGVVDGTTSPQALYPQTGSVTGGDINAAYEWGPSAYDERHRVTVAGVFDLPFGLSVAPSFTAATARPYTQFRAPNPTGDGSLFILLADGTPAGPDNARGLPLLNFNARVTENIGFSSNKKIQLFAELYNLLDRANFGNVYGGNAFSTATYNLPIGYVGGAGAVSTIPNSFQVQFGGRFSF